ncbi:conserved hypothetical protein [Flavobacterium sp. 9AF]|uniref:DUF3575 domain-containing protein n=1 Tax=Flavobacterium sp. 9AF TaxID=2653142 RepID=UPI0012F21633|nr:DUF3575 domain-containing protein [Flavobacterium sp. 9AF]VXC08740.1 conserved hypothetical protein [Flavobacterium sp. 9AF]
MNLIFKIKKIFILFLFFQFAILTVKSQNIKGNVASALLGIPNFGYEIPLGKKTSFQVDLTASFWESVQHAPQKFIMLFPEFRYYSKIVNKGFFLGTHIGVSNYTMQKYNYWSTDYYQKGFNVMYGVTTGYSFEINQKWNLELFLGGGSSQAYYKGYKISNQERYDAAKKYNKSGEWIVYRGGLMLVYKL